MSLKCIGIDIGGTKTAIVRGDENGTILEKKRFATTTKEETLEMVICPVCGQKMCQVRYVNGVIMLRVQCRRCRNYIEVDLTGTK